LRDETGRMFPGIVPVRSAAIRSIRPALPFEQFNGVFPFVTSEFSKLIKELLVFAAFPAYLR
jgi:hypothetical protein